MTVPASIFYGQTAPMGLWQCQDPRRQTIALVATAHDLVRVMWAMMRHGTTWQESAAAAA